MSIRKFIKILIIILIISLSYFLFLKIKENKISQLESINYDSSELKDKRELKNKNELNYESYNSNIIKDVKYFSIDEKGNAYNIDASIGEIDFNNSDIIFLTNVRATIKLVDNSKINIKSDYGKYNIKNYDTIFTKNVIVDHLENIITGEYLDFSINKNLLIISKEVIYKNLTNKLTADVLEMNIQTKDTKIFMQNDLKKVNIQSIK
ncbi:hypothetical protein OAB89_00925 [Candidatus Pelagibacter sp.]|jgi:hypothetical protein|nr:hypothetical protein [Candidatus Pelagibacter sp.]